MTLYLGKLLITRCQNAVTHAVFVAQIPKNWITQMAFVSRYASGKAEGWLSKWKNQARFSNVIEKNKRLACASARKTKVLL